jgi:uncharacterized protein YndB with AHSA1/START domain
MDNIRLVTILPVTPEELYDAWLSSPGHTAMTGAPATSEARVGARHTAWNGYISGELVELEPGRRILQTWRTTEFPESAPDSLLEVVLVLDGNDTRLTLIQNGIPDGQGEKYHEGWQDHYFAPMRAYFASMRPAAESEARTAAGAKKKPAPPRAKASAKRAKKAGKASAQKRGKASAKARAAAKKPARAAKGAKKAKRAASARAATTRAKSPKKAKAASAAGRKKSAKKGTRKK